MIDSPFETRPDEVLGDLLRKHLTGSDVSLFQERMQRVLAEASPSTPWDQLARWARPGLVAAGLAAAVLGWLAVRSVDRAVVPDGGAVSVQVVVAGEQTAGDLLIAAVAEGR